MKISPQNFFSFPAQNSPKIFPHKIFISHTKFLPTKLSHFLSHTRPLTFTHTHTTPPAPTSRAQPSLAQRRCRRGRAQPSTPLLLDHSTVNPNPSTLSPSPQDPFSLSPLTTPIPIHFSSPYPYPCPFRFCLNNSVRYLPGFGPAVHQECNDCGKKFNMGGPIWSTPIRDQD
ncbi:hypothetical protein ACB094_10G030500 [Castanea mollissima]